MDRTTTRRDSLVFGAAIALGLVATWWVTGVTLAQDGSTAGAIAAPPAAEDDSTAARQRLLSGLTGSKHDFSQNGRLGRDLCTPCHTPHLANAPAPELDDRSETAAPLRPYHNRAIELDGWSLLCLGCHDGVTANDVYSSSHAVTVVGQMGNSRLGTRGLRSHPVGIKYPLAAPGYHPRAAVEAAGLLMPDGRIQCGTCHDAHNTQGHPGMLKISNSRSRMCLTCHRL